MIYWINELPHAYVIESIEHTVEVLIYQIVSLCWVKKMNKMCLSYAPGTSFLETKICVIHLNVGHMRENHRDEYIIDFIMA